jgi:hypothetical protein
MNPSHLRSDFDESANEFDKKEKGNHPPYPLRNRKSNAQGGTLWFLSFFFRGIRDPRSHLPKGAAWK